ncbi:hypothetical protein Solca_2476 [Solitalea canadensis DSM 3403]|uniref:YD repeat-containing protein n=1 Tax=Solitalea canadensis (strain ATCC 29591 / DSM 3403 / JCM 21819 / LMG 8368 / NBRC 15130 / NCIMB 12057 / USAM 9D) TaxID=929556 RepID=H8KRJ0_SOLCM|nr:hypothetical protein Solca_2476 [Solitalea canadensis DSM 3403]
MIMGLMKRKTIKFLSLILCLCHFTVHSQTIPTRVDIPSPQVAAINRFIETSVGHFTGVPQISIPLYEIKIKDVMVPITLSYHAGGIRVDQEASWVGLGWNLSYGGQVTRNVRGAPDEHYFIPAVTRNTGFTTIKDFNALPHYSQDPGLQERTQNMLEAKLAINGQRDFMPDEFYYSVVGQSGKFMFNQELKKFVTFPKEDINISLSDTNLFSFLLDNGVAVDLGADGASFQSDPTGVMRATRNSWLVKKIQNTSNEEINYSYTNSSYKIPKISGQNYIQSTGAYTENLTNPGSTYVSENNTYDEALVSTISFPEGIIKFITMEREDMQGKALKEVQVLNNAQQLIRKIIFDYSYFLGKDYDVNLGRSAPVIWNYADNYRFKRLRLDSVRIVGQTSTSPIKYKFDYNTFDMMPSKYSFSQDHWGYFNGIMNHSMIPSIVVKDGVDPSLYDGGDRSVKPEKSNVFSLKSIVWPEGGKTEYTYENNNFRVKNIPQGSRELINMLVDDNLALKKAEIQISGYPRSSFAPDPDYIDPVTKARCYKKRFTVSNNSYVDPGYGWECSSDFGVKGDIDKKYDIPYGQCNVEFLLEQIKPEGRVTVKGFNNAQNAPIRVKENKTYLELLPGEYEMTVKITYQGIPVDHEYNLQSHFTYFKISWREIGEDDIVNAGGLRIKKIDYFDNNGAKIKAKSYDYTNPVDGKSSGTIAALPLYIQNKWKGGYISRPHTHYRYYFSNSVLPLLTTEGSYVGYEYVTEYDENVLNTTDRHKITYQFRYNMPYFTSFYKYMLLSLQEPDEWLQGQLLKKTYYKGSKIIKQEDYSYYYRSPHALTDINKEDWVDEINTDIISFGALTWGYANPILLALYMKDLREQGYSDRSVMWFDDTLPPDFYSQSYPELGTRASFLYGVDYVDGNTVPNIRRFTGFNKPLSKTTTLYDDNGGESVTTEKYYYEKTPVNYQLSKSEAINSKKETISQQYKYPQDYAGILVYDKMTQQHRIASVIEQTNFNSTKELTKVRNNYGFWNNNTLIAPLSIEKFNNGSLTPSQVYNFNGYDTKSNLLGVTPQKGPSTTYKWGYNQQYPVAECKNAAENEFYFESFEEDAAASIVKFHTGLKCNYGRSFTVSFTKPNSRTYTIGWFELEGNLWKYKEETYTGTKTFLASAYVDDIRIFPSDAQITTYTYEPLVGMTSSTDAKGQTTYYVYDGFQRLKWIKDQEGNILKTTDYHYQNQ